MATDGVFYNGISLEQYLLNLDASDTKGANDQIEASIWNKFANKVGAKYIRQNEEISVSQALIEVTPFIKGDTESMRSKQKICRKVAEKLSSVGYSVGGEMLRISLTSDALNIGKHSHDKYTVISPDQAQQRLNALGMSENMKGNGHMTTEQMRLKMVEFQPDSKVAKGLSCSSVVREAAQNWYNSGCPAQSVIGLNTFNKNFWKSADDADAAFGVGYCYLIGLHDNGDGTVSGYVEDVYDFEMKYNGNNNGFVDKVTNAMLKHVCELQQAGKVQQYRTLVPVTIRINQPKKESKTLISKLKDAIRPCTTQSQREEVNKIRQKKKI